MTRVTRRNVLKGGTALAVGSSFSASVLAAAPPATAITPELIAAAKKEGKAVWYTSLDLPALRFDWDAGFRVRDLLDGTEYHWGQFNYVRLDPHHHPAHVFAVQPF